MLRGVYRFEGRPAVETAIGRRLSPGEAPDGQDGSLLVVADGDSTNVVDVDGMRCWFEGRLYGEEPGLLARAVREGGIAALEELRGRFAFVLWDERRGGGWVGNDLLATQPIFTFRGVDHIAFATELPALLALLPSTPHPDEVGFLGWLGGWTVPTDRTLYDGVSRLPPGHLVDLKGQAATRRYWSPSYRGTMSGPPSELAEGLLSQLETAVSRRIAGRKSGVVLSGGLDSSIVTAVADRVGRSGPMPTYSAVFPGADYDESWKIESLDRTLGIEAKRFELEPRGAFRLNLEHLRRSGLPLAGCGALIDATMVAEAGRDGTDLVLDGQTGDELFGFSPWLIGDRMRRGRLLAALDLGRRWAGGHPGPRLQFDIVKHWGVRGGVPYGVNRLARRRRSPAETAPAWMRPEWRSPYAELEDQWAWKSGAGPLWWRYQSDVLVEAPHRELRLDYLRDRAAGVGLDSETPLYDFDLIAYCLRLDPGVMVHPDFSRPLARTAVAGLLPDDVRLDSTKANFSPFCFEIMTGADAPALDRMLNAPDARLGAYADLESVRGMWSELRPSAGRGWATTGWGTTVWRLAVAESWLRNLEDPASLDRELEMADLDAPVVRPAA